MAAGRVPTVLRERLGHEATFGLIELLNTEEKEWSSVVSDRTADRFERRLTSEMSGMKVELCQAMNDGLTGVREELATSRVEMLKRSFVFWVGQILAVIAVMAFMFRGH